MLGLRVRGRGGRDRTAPVAAPKSAFLWGSTPFLFARAKKWGGTGRASAVYCPRKRRTRTSPSPSRAKMSKDNRGSSAHANGGATKVKKALFFGGSTPFLWASTKEMGSNGSRGHRPPPNVTAHTYKVKNIRGNPRRGFPLRPPPALMRASGEFRALWSAGKGSAPAPRHL